MTKKIDIRTAGLFVILMCYLSQSLGMPLPEESVEYFFTNNTRSLQQADCQRLLDLGKSFYDQQTNTTPHLQGDLTDLPPNSHPGMVTLLPPEAIKEISHEFEHLLYRATYHPQDGKDCDEETQSLYRYILEKRKEKQLSPTTCYKALEPITKAFGEVVKVLIEAYNQEHGEDPDSQWLYNRTEWFYLRQDEACRQFKPELNREEAFIHPKHWELMARRQQHQILEEYNSILHRPRKVLLDSIRSTKTPREEETLLLPSDIENTIGRIKQRGDQYNPCSSYNLHTKPSSIDKFLCEKCNMFDEEQCRISSYIGQYKDDDRELFISEMIHRNRYYVVTVPDTGDMEQYDNTSPYYFDLHTASRHIRDTSGKGKREGRKDRRRSRTTPRPLKEVRRIKGTQLFHLGADPSQYTMEIESAGQTINIWKPSDDLPPIDFGKYDSTKGVFTVTRAGLYRINSKITYYDNSGRWCHSIKHNGTHIAKCLTSEWGINIDEGTNHYVPTVQQCANSISIYLDRGDKISITSLYGQRTLHNSPDMNFWSITKLP